ncbi:MAG: hypothetical protein AAB922_05510 [Patescibacteria group bacterium]
MSNLTKNQLEDYRKFYKDNPDDGFSPARNKAILESTIRKTNTRRVNLLRQANEQLDERVDAVWSYFKHLSQGNHTPVEKYLGKRNLAYLRGQKLVQKIKDKAIALGWAQDNNYVQ